MKKLAVLAMVVSLLGAGAVVAGEKGKEVTLEGQVVCAKCSLHEEERAKCQNVLIVENNGKERHYYLTKNSVNEEFGDVCMAKRPVRITGTVSERDGHHWIAATSIERVEDKG